MPVGKRIGANWSVRPRAAALDQRAPALAELRRQERVQRRRAAARSRAARSLRSALGTCGMRAAGVPGRAE